MEQKDVGHGEQVDSRDSRETNDHGLMLGDIVFLVWKDRRVIGTGTLGTMIVVALITLFLPKWYESSAVVMLPEKSVTTIDALAGNLGSVGSGLLGLSSPTSGNQRYLAILNSRRLREALIGRYDLKSTFEVDYVEDVLEILETSLIAETDKKNGTIIVSMRFKNDPIQTADMANFVVQELDKINRELSTEQARSARVFVEESLAEAKNGLRRAEDSLNAFQNRHGVIAITEQTRAGIEAAALLHAELARVEVEYNVKKMTLGVDHPDIRRLESQLRELRKNQDRFEYGGYELSAFIPFKQTPNLGLAYARLFREVQISTKIVEFLIPQYEQAKIQEAKDTPTLLVLDAARPAEYPFKPRKKMITLIAGFVTFCLLLGWAYGADVIRRRMATESGSNGWADALNKTPRLKKIIFAIEK